MSPTREAGAIVAVIGIAASVAIAVGGCGHDAHVSSRDTGPAEKINMPDQFDTVATKCSHGFRIFETSDDGALTAVRDPSCRR